MNDKHKKEKNNISEAEILFNLRNINLNLSILYFEEKLKKEWENSKKYIEFFDESKQFWKSSFVYVVYLGINQFFNIFKEIKTKIKKFLNLYGTFKYNIQDFYLDYMNYFKEYNELLNKIQMNKNYSLIYSNDIEYKKKLTIKNPLILGIVSYDSKDFFIIGPLLFCEIYLIMNDPSLEYNTKHQILEFYLKKKICHEILHTATSQWRYIYNSAYHKLIENNLIKTEQEFALKFPNDFVLELINHLLQFFYIHKNIEYFKFEKLKLINKETIFIHKIVNFTSLSGLDKIFYVERILISLFEGGYEQIPFFCFPTEKTIYFHDFIKDRFIILYDVIKNHYKSNNIKFIEKSRLDWIAISQHFVQFYYYILNCNFDNAKYIFRKFNILIQKKFLNIFKFKSNPYNLKAIKKFRQNLKDGFVVAVRFFLTSLLFLNIIFEFFLLDKKSSKLFLKKLETILSKNKYSNFHLRKIAIF